MSVCTVQYMVYFPRRLDKERRIIEAPGLPGQHTCDVSHTNEIQVTSLIVVSYRPVATFETFKYLERHLHQSLAGQLLHCS